MYDANGRLTSWSFTPQNGSPVQESYIYDAAGNMLRKGSRDFSYNNANQITNSGFTYDNNGNMTSDGTFNYTYDTESQLTQVKRVSDNSLVATYNYRHDGLRTSKTVYSGQTSQTTYFNWDAFGRLVRESDSAGNVSFYNYDNQGKLVCFRKNNYTYEVHLNLRGDVYLLTNIDGGFYAKYNYDPWGNQISYSGWISAPFRYAGYYYDEETGLYYLKSRYYSPALGRFLTKDSIKYIKYKNPQTLNLYSYTGSNPVNNVDPTGEIPVRATWKAFEDKLGELLDTAKNSKKGLGNRIVDYITKTGEAREAKSGEYISNSPQLRDFMRQFGDKFRLVINETTECSKPLLKNLKNTGGKLYRMVNGKLIPYNIDEALKAPPSIFVFPPGWENWFQEDYGT
ncbi:YD repeat protein [Desulfofarcimen acetoxidans DSM 771]|uniref:YD repeat protein n=1 Tax=Desulfofarcimen acetoxidans (strain ATCC 49208 / DSM 771 / KCTC 5769 / VKM B-1644 / 5575) TaxID=485916 RepID=C8W2A9_DESAS|nr:RHS repeat-associated core domain-containing protein [Desulfofarcimen acetoxidans]ACV61773.1 YD repeat protein [Desulfofarcimen acetoxidans DSM 771]